MKGIILSGGTGTRLYPLTKSISKQLLPIYDKPMIYYPLSVLMLAGIKEILIISSEIDMPMYKDLLGVGSQFGLSLNYAVQNKPNGIGEAFTIGEKFIGENNVCLILGDNFFYGQGFTETLFRCQKDNDGATIFGYQVSDPKRFGIVEIDKDNNPLSINEKPQYPKSNYAVTGLYIYDKEVVDISKSLKKSYRGELEISSINKIYLDNKQLSLEILGRGFCWLDVGTHESLIEASVFVRTIEKRQGLKIGCLEEIAFQQNWIDEETVLSQANFFKNSDYGKYLLKLIN